MQTDLKVQQRFVNTYNRVEDFKRMLAAPVRQSQPMLLKSSARTRWPKRATTGKFSQKAGAATSRTER
jgi:hypothetical protein